MSNLANRLSSLFGGTTNNQKFRNQNHHYNSNQILPTTISNDRSPSSIGASFQHPNSPAMPYLNGSRYDFPSKSRTGGVEVEMPRGRRTYEEEVEEAFEEDTYGNKPSEPSSLEESSTVMYNTREWTDAAVAREGVMREELEEMEEEGYTTSLGVYAGGSEGDVSVTRDMEDSDLERGGYMRPTGSRSPSPAPAAVFDNKVASSSSSLSSLAPSRSNSLQPPPSPVTQPSRRLSNIPAATPSGIATPQPPENPFASLSSFHRAPLPMDSKFQSRRFSVQPKPYPIPEIITSQRRLATLAPTPPPKLTSPPLPPPSLSHLLHLASYPPLGTTFSMIKSHLPLELTVSLSAPLTPRISQRLLTHLSETGGPSPLLTLPAPSSSFQAPAPELMKLLTNLHAQAQKVSFNQKQTGSYILPRSFLEMFTIHDGQDPSTVGSFRDGSGGQGGGLVWGLWMMSLEEIEKEWGFWRRWDGVGAKPQKVDVKGKGKESSGEGPLESVPLQTPPNLFSPNPSSNGYFPQNLNMTSCPTGWIREAYSYPGWIPILTDRCGNYIGIDLDPPVWEDEEAINSNLSISTEYNESPRPSLTSLTSPTSSKPPSRAPSPSHPLMSNGETITSNPTSRTSSVASLPTPTSSKRKRGGVPGQVIAFGREIDEKVVLYGCEGAGGWGRFLRGFAEDVERGGRGFSVFGTAASVIDEVEERKRLEGNGGFIVESESEEDGIGELGYFENGTDGAFDNDSEDDYSSLANHHRRTAAKPARKHQPKPSLGSSVQRWRLQPQWKKWVNDNPDSGGVIGALAERSRRLWKEREGLMGGRELERLQREGKGKAKVGIDGIVMPSPISTVRGSNPQSPLPTSPTSTQYATVIAEGSRATFNLNDMKSRSHRTGSAASGSTSSLSTRAYKPPPPPMPLDLPTVEEFRGTNRDYVVPTSPLATDNIAGMRNNRIESILSEEPISTSPSRTSFTGGLSKALSGLGIMGGKRDSTLLPMVNVSGGNSRRNSNEADMGVEMMTPGFTGSEAPSRSPRHHSKEQSWGSEINVVVPEDSKIKSPTCSGNNSPLVTSPPGSTPASPMPLSRSPPSSSNLPKMGSLVVEPTGDVGDGMLSPSADTGFKNDTTTSISPMVEDAVTN